MTKGIKRTDYLLTERPMLSGNRVNRQHHTLRRTQVDLRIIIASLTIFARLGSAPFLRRVSTVAVWPFWLAIDRGVTAPYEGVEN